tara:strand:+ start:303 stop:782 length:480 start_codon:yes stop_codon:yes gene_type:complete
MREILFRGRDGLGKWVYGSGVFFDGVNTWLYANEVKAAMANNLDKYIVSRESVGQYTGLKDNNGVKIFEGDLVEFTDVSYGVFITEVSWNEDRAMFCCDVTKMPWQNKQLKMPNKEWTRKHDPCNCDGAMYATKFTPLGSNLEKIKIIGNIHETPELIK